MWGKGKMFQIETGHAFINRACRQRPDKCVLAEMRFAIQAACLGTLLAWISACRIRLLAWQRSHIQRLDLLHCT